MSYATIMRFGITNEELIQEVIDEVNRAQGDTRFACQVALTEQSSLPQRGKWLRLHPASNVTHGVRNLY